MGAGDLAEGADGPAAPPTVMLPLEEEGTSVVSGRPSSTQRARPPSISLSRSSPKRPEDPESVGRPPVVLVSVEDHRRVRVDPFGAKQGLEPGPGRDNPVATGSFRSLTQSILTAPGMWPVSYSKKVFIGLDQPDRSIVQSLSDPIGGDQHLGLLPRVSIGVTGAAFTCVIGTSRNEAAAALKGSRGRQTSKKGHFPRRLTPATRAARGECNTNRSLRASCLTNTTAAVGMSRWDIWL